MHRCRILGICAHEADLAPLASLPADEFELTQSAYSAQSVRAALEGAFDLILLDCRSEPSRGIQLCRGLRAVDELSATRILVLTLPSSSGVRVAALEAGADDCVSDAPDSREFGLRLQAAARRIGGSAEERRLSYADVELDLDRFRVKRNGECIYLPHVQFRLLRHFLEYPTIVFSRRQLLEQVWNDTSLDERSVNVAIVRLRRAINSRGGPNLIRSVPGLGYALDVDSA